MNDLLKFIKFTHDFQKILRGVYVAGLDRKENDLEHTGQLALVAFYIVSTQNLKMNLEKVLGYSLVHDLVETYAGDTDFYLASKSEKESKDEREKDSFERIKKEFPKFSEMSNLIVSYESRQDKESNFVYALDKLLVKLNVYLDKGRSWKKDKVTFQKFLEVSAKIKSSKDIDKIWNDFIKLVEKEKENLFPK